MRWQHGQTEIAELIDAGGLVPITNGAAVADDLVARARAAVLERGSNVAIVTLCAQALLAAQGLAVSDGERPQLASEAMDHQFLGDLGVGPFDLLRLVPDGDESPTAKAKDLAAEVDAVVAMDAAEETHAAVWALEFTERLLRSGLLLPFVANADG